MTNEYKSRHELEQETAKKCIWIQQIDVNPTTWGCQYADLLLSAQNRGLTGEDTPVHLKDTVICCNKADAFYSEGYEGFVCNEHFGSCQACSDTLLDIQKGII